ncbi:DEAD/DEAH box helicase [Nesterenkonia sp.]|uniref:DEAD/DEAH box helicase n=1 Tax=Nesterenkonia sp. TaxID=704201 RepID=UPI00262821C9|nr:DEAD/DEAH box helicase [Nesterenkonia sp.]
MGTQLPDAVRLDGAAEESTELWPTEHSRSLVESLTEYLTTTFALSDSRAATTLTEFLQHPEEGMFRGPYVRLRLPFVSPEGALDAQGRPKSLDFYPSHYPPYGHQLAAFERLTTKPDPESSSPFREPQPTLVTTGTGSGKTEAFLYPILDHVLRAQQAGTVGIKALILYPMNALANDQANRLTELITQVPELSGVRAALYTGQEKQERAQVTADGLITDRRAIRRDPPDILLTNYKMLDQLLLRAEDQLLWSASATSLQYLVLDEFHTYDGAQGTDVAMLLRRLGAALKSHWPEDLSTHPDGLSEDHRARPLGRITPVATSATLGGPPSEGETSPMLEFARTVFGIEFSPASIVPETRVSIDQWLNQKPPSPVQPREDLDIAARVASVNTDLAAGAPPRQLIRAVWGALFDDTPVPEELPQILAGLKAHRWVRRLLDRAQQAVRLRHLAEELITAPSVTPEAGEEFLSHVLAVLSHLRKHLGPETVTVETHLWVRELTRLDSALAHSAHYSWADDGPVASNPDDPEHVSLPAIYCRHCGARGWATVLTADGAFIELNSATVREASVRRNPRFRAMMDAAFEADELNAEGHDLNGVEGLHYLHTRERMFLDQPFKAGNEPKDEYEADFYDGRIIAVRTHAGLTADDLSAKQVCPVCSTTDAIRFVGSAVATLLTVAVTGLFGADHLNRVEKKTLIFTDSVQDAAHRAGFIQARSHTFTLRTLLRRGLAHLAEEGHAEPSLAETVDAVVALADSEGPAGRFMLVPPELTDHRSFRAYWDPDASHQARTAAREAVRRRLLFDASLEFGLQARFGRTLELTGTAVAEVCAPDGQELTEIAAAALAARGDQLDIAADRDAQRLSQWVRGVLIRMRLQGSIRHPWLEAYQTHDGRRWHVWGGRRRDQGMPAFPVGRSTPAFPRIGRREKPRDSELDAVTTRESWYFWWTRRSLGIGSEEAGHAARQLFEHLAEAGVVVPTTTQDGAAVIYGISPERITLTLTDDADLAAKRHTLQCSVCRSQTYGTLRVIEEMGQAPCLNQKCLGRLEPPPMGFIAENYYRDHLYSAENTARVIAREHTSLLPDETRLTYEEKFRGDVLDTDAPNVLVATPTLEMGIDIGSLSTVMLSSMPTSVASYVQRVGRAGRLTGNSLALAFVRGRGEHLPKLNDPLSIINGEVRPPATYLRADEILRRQFIAFCCDRLARSGTSRQPRSLLHALKDVSEQTYFGDITAMLRSAGEPIVSEFLDQFGAELTDDAAQRLAAWALPSGEGDSGLELRIHTASARFNQDLLEEQGHRDRLAHTIIPALRDRLVEAVRTAGTGSKQVKEAQREVKSAEAALKRSERKIQEMSTKNWWIAGLERYGLLPNYTLIDDSVTLDARVSWLDEESGQWEAEAFELQRGSATALREFAPGSTFYAQGMELSIDAVELGAEQREIAHWQVCPDCGWINTGLTPQPTEDGSPRWHLAPQCPRCGTDAVQDTGQVLDVVVLTKVTADVRRDEAQISDRVEDRRQTGYEILPAADLDLEAASHSWFAAELAFGADVLPEVTLRWLNLGQRGHHAVGRTLAGHDVQAPLFRVCAECGTLDRNVQANRPEDHRFWCSRRNHAEEHSLQIALARELTTQGVLLHLPDSLVDDDYTIPTLQAALLLGLHEAFGGTPAHLGVLDVPETAAMAAGGFSARTLLLHDNVPGGTGYLAEFGSPERVHQLLTAAWNRVRHHRCDAESEHRLACHQCLLPHAQPGTLDRVSRSAADRILSSLLNPAAAENPPQDSPAEGGLPWTVTHQRPVRSSVAESRLERRFRDALRERLRAVNAQVTEDIQSGYLVLNFRLQGDRRMWRLIPQPHLGSTRPDFILQAPGVPSLAIYTDGRQYHATTEINRLADDAQKRHELRVDGEHLPWGITYDDVDLFASGEQPGEDSRPLSWLNQRLVEGYVRKGALDAKLLRAARSSAMHLLWEWILAPDAERFRSFADHLLLTTLVDAQPPGMEELAQASAAQDSVQVPLDLLRRRLQLGGAPNDRWWHRSLGAAELYVAGNPKAARQLRVSLSLDDSDQAVARPTFPDEWREWLLLSTVLGFRDTTHTAITTRKAVPNILAGDALALRSAQPQAAAADITHGSEEISVGWTKLVEEALSPEEEQLLRAMAQRRLPVPEVGEEYDGGVVVDIAYPDQRVAVMISDSAETHLLEQAGWTVLVTTDADEIAETLRS